MYPSSTLRRSDGDAASAPQGDYDHRRHHHHHPHHHHHHHHPPPLQPAPHDHRQPFSFSPARDPVAAASNGPIHSTGNASPPSRPQPLHPTSHYKSPQAVPSSPRATLPPIKSSMFSRDPPLPPPPPPPAPSTSTFYDPTQDAGDRVDSRPSSRYDAYPSEATVRLAESNMRATPAREHHTLASTQHREVAPFADSRSGAQSSPYDSKPFRSPTALAFPRVSPLNSQHRNHGYEDSHPSMSPKTFAHNSRVSSVANLSPPAIRPSRDTPSRTADPMSLSSIMSGNDQEPLPHSTPSAPKSSAKVSAVRDLESPAPAAASIETIAPPAPAKIQVLKFVPNGHDSFEPALDPPPTRSPLPAHPPHRRPRPSPDDIDYHVAKIELTEDENYELTPASQKIWKVDYAERGLKRFRDVQLAERGKRKRRRTYYARRFSEIFEAYAIRAKEEFYLRNEQQAWLDVQAQEVAEEKERKKDMQRKRRREKALQDESKKRDEAIERAERAADREERERAIKEARKHDKKVRQKTHLLHGDVPSKEIREVTPQGLNLEGGTMSTFHTTEDAPREPGRRGGRRGGLTARPRKSKEKKQAEKDQAAAAQAAIDRGEELPAIAPKEAVRLEKLERVEKEVVPEEPPPPPPPPEIIPYTSKVYNQLFDSIWKDISRKDVGKTYRIKNDSISIKQSNLRKTAQLAAKEARRWQLKTNKSTKDVQARAKRSMREMVGFWRRNERDERDQRKMAEKQELENAKRAEAEREANRQKRKLNFLISQTEIFSHFVGKKVKTQEVERSTDDASAVAVPPAPEADPSKAMQIPDAPDKVAPKVTNFEELDFDDDDETALQNAAMANAQNAVMEAQERARRFNDGPDEEPDEDGEMNFQNPTSLQNMDVPQPKMLSCQLKEYQLKGLNWLVNLYEQGINGILADEMGLGKTVQSISIMAYLAERYDIWGPFLVIAPASTLHNWQQEIARFVPNLKVVPYWGNAKDRKVLRKFWDRKHITYNKDSPFHVLITSYQLVVQDTQYFQKMRWQYMILDEAQAIKSASSSRWKSLLGFHTRNRLLLTGTPIQNNMQELWALLHFIMPSLFDSHDEFSDWFSKDIESHAQSNTQLNEDQLKRLHMILKPFMLRRIKKHVQKELGDKIEKELYCNLTYRQRAYYTNLRNKISIMDLIEKAAVGDDQDTATLMNLVMQFRKVCNHPDLFERAETTSPFSFSYWAETASFLREGSFVNVSYSVRNPIEYHLPRLVYRNGGRLGVAGPDNDAAGWRHKMLGEMMSIWSGRHIAESARKGGTFGFIRFVDHSASEISELSRKDLFQRAVALHKNRRLPAKAGWMGLDTSPLRHLFNIAERADLHAAAETTVERYLSSLLNVSCSRFEADGLHIIEPLAHPAASAPPIAFVCSSHATAHETANALFNIPMRTALSPVPPAIESALVAAKVPLTLHPSEFDLLPAPTSRKARFTHIGVPSMRRFVSDSGKLAALDALLGQLKEEGHRVLLYFQMTRMIDLMEEYLTYRNYKYCRLDGSTKLEDRRDTVADFQTRPEIFVFLLSTRAGGLGINLTSADTVIFYDSDWNPTIDSQAMDRAHRLGQTKQVTVYRLITRGTIEERIRKRALQKEEVQRVVISGQTTSVGGEKKSVVDFNARRAENRTKDIALWLADDDQARLIEEREREMVARGEATGAGRKRKRAPAEKGAGAKSLEDLYHEGEGHFEDSAKPSGAATPVEGIPPKKRRGGTSKKAKTVKQRLAIADGEVGV